MKEIPVVVAQGGLSKVTPSNWLAMRKCAWQVLLSKYYKDKPLLPTHPNAVLGNILHNALEKITKGELKTRYDFDSWWEAAVAKSEEDLVRKNWYQLVPLKENAHHFGLKKIQVRNRLSDVQNTSFVQSGTFTRLPEKKLSSSNGLLSGKLDCIIWKGQEVEIRDYKTGVITTEGEEQESTKIKEEYELQMKLYACLFREQYDYFPDKLVLEDLYCKEYEVSFTVDECLRLIDEVNCTLKSINHKIISGAWEELANTGEHCANCQNRPSCSKYLSLLQSIPLAEDQFRLDIIGVLLSCEENNFGALVLKLEKDGQVYSITGMNAELTTKVSGMTNHKFAIFNIKPAGAQKFLYSKFSHIYAL